MKSWEALQNSFGKLNKAGISAGLRVSKGKTKTMLFDSEDIENKIIIGNETIENVKEFVYLGSVFTWDNDCQRDIRARIAKAKGVMAGFNNLWKSKQISYSTKLTIVKTCVFSVALYAFETLTMKKADEEKILAFEMYCCRRILRSS